MLDAVQNHTAEVVLFDEIRDAKEVDPLSKFWTGREGRERGEGRGRGGVRALQVPLVVV